MSLICYLSEDKLFSIYSEFEVNKPKRVSNSDETIPPTALWISTLTSLKRFYNNG
jgi:hypothetical protein